MFGFFFKLILLLFLATGSYLAYLSTNQIEIETSLESSERIYSLKNAEFFGSDTQGELTYKIFSKKAKTESGDDQIILEHVNLEYYSDELNDWKISSEKGAMYDGLGSETITVEGVDNLYEAEIDIIPDRIEAVTMIIAGIITKGEITIENIDPSHIKQPIELIRQCGARFEMFKDALLVSSPDKIKPMNFETQPYTGIPTDIQAQLMALNAIAEGHSRITETIFENRFMHALELKRMGANISIAGNKAKVSGNINFAAAELMATDLRASVSLILAALTTKGKSVINRIYHLDRGYENIEKKLKKVGAKIRRVN